MGVVLGIILGSLLAPRFVQPSLPLEGTTFFKVSEREDTVAMKEMIKLGDILHSDLKLVTGYWKIPQNSKHNVQHYRRAIGKTLDFFVNAGAAVTYFHNIDLQNSQDPIANILKSKGSHNIEFIHRPTH